MDAKIQIGLGTLVGVGIGYGLAKWLGDTSSKPTAASGWLPSAGPGFVAPPVDAPWLNVAPSLRPTVVAPGVKNPYFGRLAPIDAHAAGAPPVDGSVTTNTTDSFSDGFFAVPSNPENWRWERDYDMVFRPCADAVLGRAHPSNAERDRALEYCRTQAKGYADQQQKLRIAQGIGVQSTPRFPTQFAAKR